MPTRVFRPFDATTTGALNDGIPSPRRIRSRLFSSPQRFTPPRGFTALSRAAYAHGIHFDPLWTSSIVCPRETLPIRSLLPSQATEACLQRAIGKSKTSTNVRVPKETSIRSLNQLQAVNSCLCQTSGSRKTKPNKSSREIVRPIPEPTASSRFVSPCPLGPSRTSSISPTPKGLSARSLARPQAAEPCLRRAFRSNKTKSSSRVS